MKTVAASVVPAKHARKRTPSQKAADAVLIEHWHVRGKTPRQIVELLAAERPYRLSHSQIKQDLQGLAEQWRREAQVIIAEAVASELKGLKAQEDELWIAWEQSKKDAVTKTAEQTGATKGKAKPNKSRVVVEGQTGDPQYMRLILEIRAQRRQLLGLDKPTKLEHIGESGGPMQFAIRLTAAELSPMAPAVLNETQTG